MFLTEDQRAIQLDKMFAAPDHWGPHQVFDTVLDRLPAGDIATADSGAHRIMLSQKWRCPSPQILLQSTCFCTMGIARPHAMGYANAAGAKGPNTIKPATVRR